MNKGRVFHRCSVMLSVGFVRNAVALVRLWRTSATAHLIHPSSFILPYLTVTKSLWFNRATMSDERICRSRFGLSGTSVFA